MMSRKSVRQEDTGSQANYPDNSVTIEQLQNRIAEWPPRSRVGTDSVGIMVINNSDSVNLARREYSVDFTEQCRILLFKTFPKLAALRYPIRAIDPRIYPRPQ
jgi:hypothetical protein